MKMEELAYTLSDKNGADITYTIVEYGAADTFDFMPNGGTVRRVKKQNGKWVQVSGEDTDTSILQKLGDLMGIHHQKTQR